MDKFEEFVEAQSSATLNAVVYTVLGENILKYDPAEYEWMSQEIKIELIEQLDKAILSRFPPEAMDEIDRLLDETAAEDIDTLLRQKATEWNIDINTIIFDTVMRFIEFYKNIAFSKINDTVIDIPQAESKKLEGVVVDKTKITGQDISNMTEAEVDEWLKDILSP